VRASNDKPNMLCKIADPSLTPNPVVWPSVGGRPAEAAVTASRGASQPNESAPAATVEGEELKRRLADLERTRQIELTRARESAFQDGLRQGREQAASEVKAATDRFAQMLRDLSSLRRKVRNDAEMDVLKLSLAIARRILHREVATDPEAIQGLVHAALEKLQNREVSCVRVSPSSVEAVRSALERAGSTPAIQVLADPSLKDGGLVFETTLGELDASIDTQLQEIQRGFADRLSLR
jgi:flagellar assembly protein FliH